MTAADDYEAQRRRNIAEIKQTMDALGIVGQMGPPAGAAAAAPVGRATAKRRRERLPPREGARRSRRLASAPAERPDGLADDEIPAAERDDEVPAKRQRRAPAAPRPRDPDEEVPEPVGGSQSSRFLELDLGAAAQTLGELFRTKADVVVPLGADPALRARFNKFSGVVEWRNAALLFINVESGGYANKFRGDTVSWFASSRQTAESPVIARLLAGEFEQVFLFCRIPGEPYLGVGPVALCGSDVDVHPVRTEWRIAEFGRLRTESDYFERMVQS